MNNSRASSFNPLGYYKKLTECISKKSNHKAVLKQINRGQNISKPMITREHLQAKIMAKFNQKNNRESGDGLQNTEVASGRGSKEKINFVSKFSDTTKTKNKKDEEPYVNLSDSFFRSFTGPSDTSLFKIPEAPVKDTLKKRKVNHPEQDPEPPPSLNFSLNSLKSANFNPNPNQASTPIEDKKKPMFTDPRDIESYFSARPVVEDVPEDTHFVFDARAKEVSGMVAKVAKKIDSTCFAQYPDPIIDIHGRIMEIYEASCRIPRLMNETLMSSASITKCNVDYPSVDTSQPVEPLMKLVKPDQEVFEEDFEELKNEIKYGSEEDGYDEEDSFNETSDIFGWTNSKPLEREDPAAQWSKTFIIADSPKASDNQKASQLPTISLEDTLEKLFSQKIETADFWTTKEASDSGDPLSFSPVLFSFSPKMKNSFDETLMDWSASLDDPKDSSFAVFQSPFGESNKSQSRTSLESQAKPLRHSKKRKRSRNSQDKRNSQPLRPSRYSQVSRRPRKSRHSSQHPETQNLSQEIKESDSTLSTYVWPPNFKLFSPSKTIDQAIDETSEFLLPPRKLFKNSFQLI